MNRIFSFTKSSLKIGVHYITQSGNYNVQVTNSNGCKIAVGINILPDGFNNFSNEEKTYLFPNPATNQLTVHTSSFHNEGVIVSIMNVLGQTVQQEKIKWNADVSLNIKNLSASIYFVQLSDQETSAVLKFVKE